MREVRGGVSGGVRGGETRDARDADLTRQTATVLVRLLISRDDYRRRWQPHMQRASRAAVHQSAVVAVLAQHLWDTGQVSDTDRGLTARLKHVVSRALSGRHLSPATLRLFIDAFAMGQHDATELWATRTGGDPLRTAVVRSDFAVVQTEIPTPPRYQTVSLHDVHSVGETGLPVAHRTVHVVRALEDFATYPYRFDTDAATVEVLRGGTAGPLNHYPEDDTYGVDIEFTRPLARGDTASFEYRTTFDYRIAPPPEFRRAVRRRADNVTIQVEFSPGRLPRRLWWARWDDHTQTEPVEREPVELAPDRAVHRYLDAVVASVVGFVWEFDRPVRL